MLFDEPHHFPERGSYTGLRTSGRPSYKRRLFRPGNLKTYTKFDIWPMCPYTYAW